MATDPPGVLQRFPTGADLKEHACKQKALAFIFANSFGKGVTDFFLRAAQAHTGFVLLQSGRVGYFRSSKI